jgi:hypothetical protein
MSLDPITESIAHFIGHFQIAVEEARLRDNYNEFRALERKEDDEARPEFGPVRLTAPLAPEGYDPTVKAPPAPAAPLVGAAGPAFAEMPAGPGFFPDLDLATLFPPGDPMSSQGGGSVLLPFVPIPSSVATITLQSIGLSDNDVLGDPEAAGFLPPDVFAALLQGAIALADEMMPLSLDAVTGAVLDDPLAAIALIDSLADVALPAIDGVTGSVRFDDDAEGRFINGVAIEDELPLRDDLLPAYLQRKHADPDDGDAAAKDIKWMSEVGYVKPDVPDAQHAVTAGANELTNAAVIYTNWIDAAVIAVAGDVVSFDAVAQVNVLSDRDTLDGHAFAGPAASKAVNAAEFSTTASSLKSPGFADGAGLPSVWNLKSIKGDVILANHVKQHSFVTDTDRLDLTFTAATTTVVAGENQTFNLFDVEEIGFGYDLILVGGSMVTMNLVSQTNVLLDDDAFTGPGLGDAALSGDDNLVANTARILREGADEHVEMARAFADALKDMAKGAADLAEEVARDNAFAGLETLRALHIEGNLTQLNLIDQVNYLGDQDQVHMALDAVASMIGGAAVSVSTGANALMNAATIMTAGLDSKIMAGGAIYDDALLYQAELIDTDAAPNGVSVKALASEAVAFLADDMVGSSLSDAIEAAGYVDDSHHGGTSLDVMQTMTT